MNRLPWLRLVAAVVTKNAIMRVKASIATVTRRPTADGILIRINVQGAIARFCALSA